MIFYNCKWVVKLIGWTMEDGITPYGWCCFPFIFFVKPKEEVTERQMKHEKYHYWHQARMLIIFYHIMYIYLWLKHGYWNHPYEIRARRAEGG